MSDFVFDKEFRFTGLIGKPEMSIKATQLDIHLIMNVPDVSRTGQPCEVHCEARHFADGFFRIHIVGAQAPRIEALSGKGDPIPFFKLLCDLQREFLATPKDQRPETHPWLTVGQEFIERNTQ